MNSLSSRPWDEAFLCAPEFSPVLLCGLEVVYYFVLCDVVLLEHVCMHDLEHRHVSHLAELDVSDSVLHVLQSRQFCWDVSAVSLFHFIFSGWCGYDRCLRVCGFPFSHFKLQKIEMDVQLTVLVTVSLVA